MLVLKMFRAMHYVETPSPQMKQSKICSGSEHIVLLGQGFIVTANLISRRPVQKLRWIAGP